MKALWIVPEKSIVLNYLNCKIDTRPARAAGNRPMDNSPDEKPLKTTSFVIHATRGVIRDQNTRRNAMLFLLALALLLLISGFTFLQPALNQKEHPWRVIFFWIVCIWLTFTSLLLALFDLLVLRLQARQAERALRKKLDATRSTFNK
jgi:hypothetical protein